MQKAKTCCFPQRIMNIQIMAQICFFRKSKSVNLEISATQDFDFFLDSTAKRLCKQYFFVAHGTLIGNIR